MARAPMKYQFEGTLKGDAVSGNYMNPLGGTGEYSHCKAHVRGGDEVVHREALVRRQVQGNLDRQGPRRRSPRLTPLGEGRSRAPLTRAGSGLGCSAELRSSCPVSTSYRNPPTRRRERYGHDRTRWTSARTVASWSSVTRKARLRVSGRRHRPAPRECRPRRPTHRHFVWATTIARSTPRRYDASTSVRSTSSVTRHPRCAGSSRRRARGRASSAARRGVDAGEYRESLCRARLEPGQPESCAYAALAASTSANVGSLDTDAS